ncbi:hypothetical protein [Streptomyces sp. NPDC056227]|uniref:hypothetical protein n=1 Tax=Streptomyces sp. NPDC056227 TaxID=3345753 RepID=UPI0035E38047
MAVVTASALPLAVSLMSPPEVRGRALDAVVEEEPLLGAERGGKIVEHAQQHLDALGVRLLGDGGVPDRAVAQGVRRGGTGLAGERHDDAEREVVRLDVGQEAREGLHIGAEQTLRHLLHGGAEVRVRPEQTGLADLDPEGHSLQVLLGLVQVGELAALQPPAGGRAEPLGELADVVHVRRLQDVLVALGVEEFLTLESVPQRLPYSAFGSLLPGG